MNKIHIASLSAIGYTVCGKPIGQREIKRKDQLKKNDTVCPICAKAKPKQLIIE